MEENNKMATKKYWVCQMYENENLTIEEIAKALQLPQREVYKILKEEGLV